MSKIKSVNQHFVFSLLATTTTPCHWQTFFSTFDTAHLDCSEIRGWSFQFRNSSSQSHLKRSTMVLFVMRAHVYRVHGSDFLPVFCLFDILCYCRLTSGFDPATSLMTFSVVSSSVLLLCFELLIVEVSFERKQLVFGVLYVALGSNIIRYTESGEWCGRGVLTLVAAS